MYMKYIRIISLCLFIFVSRSFGQTPQSLPWNLALSAAGISSEDSTVTCTDNSGNIYVTGRSSSSSLNFGNGVSLTGSGTFLAKWSSTGTPLWAIRIAGANNGTTKVIRCDNSGNIYLSMDSTTSTTFWSGILKFDTNGSRIWTKGGIYSPNVNNGIGIINDFILDNLGNVIIQFSQCSGSGGNFAGTSIVFTPVPECLLLMKLDNSGNVLWYKQSTSQGICTNRVTNIAVNSNNDIFLFTHRGAPCGLSDFGFDNIVLPLNGANLMAFKFSSAGTVLAASLIGNSNNYCTLNDLNVMCAPSGNIYVEFSGDGQLRNGTFNLYDSVAVQNGSESAVLFKINSSLSPLWVKAHQKSFLAFGPIERSQKMYLDNQENVYTAEEYFNQVSVGGNIFPISAGSQTNTSDILVLKYTSSGALVGAGTVFSSSMDKITGMAVDVNGNAILTGNFSGSQLHAGSYTLNNAGGSDFFVTRISGCLGSPVASISADGPTSFCAGNSVILSATNVPGATFQWKKNNVNIANATTRSYSCSSTGTFTCIVTNTCGTTTTNAISVSTITNAAVTFTTSGSTSFCAGDSITVNATNLGSNYSIQWYRNNSSIQNAIGYSLVVKQPGTYKTVTKNLTTGCSRISATSVTTTVNCRLSNPNSISVAPMELESPITLDDEEHAAKTASSNSSQPIHLFPNPNSGSFTLEMDGLEGLVEIQVVDVFGKIVYTDSIMANDNNFHTNIDLGDAMKAGIYLVRVHNNGLQHESKVILQ